MSVAVLPFVNFTDALPGAPPPASSDSHSKPSRLLQSQGHLMSAPHIIGWGHTPFGTLAQLDAEQMFRDAALPALKTAGL